MNWKVIVVIMLSLLLISMLLVLKQKKIPINIGILYTTSGGSMASNEVECYKATKNAIDVFNKNQNKYKINTVEFNPKSDTELYKKGAEELLSENNDLTMVIGVWRSVDRKAVLPIFERTNNLLNYSVQYEGYECSKNILYFGACPNQQINIGIEYAIKNISPNIILIGSDYVFPRTANDIMKKYIEKYSSNLLLEQYVSLDADTSIFDSICDNIIGLCKGKDKCVIMNTINGDANKSFFHTLNQKFRADATNNQYIRSGKIPIISFSISANELQNMDIEDVYGDYHIWNYSQDDRSYDTFLETMMKKNNDTLNSMIESFKNTTEVNGDPSYHSFLSVYFFCHFLLNNELKNYDSKSIREQYMSYKNQRVLTETGYLRLNDNNHLDNPVFILKINLDKKYDTIYRTPVEINPNPWHDRFSSIKYNCNNQYSFLGNKFIESK